MQRQSAISWLDFEVLAPRLRSELQPHAFLQQFDLPFRTQLQSCYWLVPVHVKQKQFRQRLSLLVGH